MRKRRPGRPTGRAKGYGKRPWHPTRLTERDKQIIDFVVANPDVPRWQVAELFGISPSRLSALTCSPVGSMYHINRFIEFSGLATENQD